MTQFSPQQQQPGSGYQIVEHHIDPVVRDYVLQNERDIAAWDDQFDALKRRFWLLLYGLPLLLELPVLFWEYPFWQRFVSSSDPQQFLTTVLILFLFTLFDILEGFAAYGLAITILKHRLPRRPTPTSIAMPTLPGSNVAEVRHTFTPASSTLNLNYGEGYRAAQPPYPG